MNQPVLLPDGDLSICSFDYGFRCTYGNLFSEKLSVLRSRWLRKFQRLILRACSTLALNVSTTDNYINGFDHNIRGWILRKISHKSFESLTQKIFLKVYTNNANFLSKIQAFFSFFSIILLIITKKII